VTTCTTMRSAAMLSVGLFLAGTLMLTFAECTGWAVPAIQIALLLVLGAAVTLVVALLIALWPGNARRLTECLH